MICSQCGTENEASDKFCEQCGALLMAPANDAGEEFAGGFSATVMAGPAAPSVLVRLDESGEQEYQLGSRAVIGRLDTCDVPINDKSVSREHARLSRLRDGYVIEDLGSTNGTLVNGRRIDEAVILHPGDIVTVGSIDFRFDVEGTKTEQDDTTGGWRTEAMPTPAGWGFPSDSANQTLDTWRTAQSAAPEAPQPPPPIEPERPEDGQAVAFPPLEPFAAPPPPQTAGFEEPEAGEPAAEAPAPAMTGDVDDQSVQAESSAEESQVQEAPAPAVQPTPPPPTPTRPSTDDTTEMAEQLTGLIQDLARQLREARTERDALQQQIPALEQAGAARSSVRQSLQNLPSATVSPDGVQSLKDLLDSLVQSPKDLDLLTQVALRASDLAAMANDYVQLQGTIDDIARHVGLRPAP